MGKRGPDPIPDAQRRKRRVSVYLTEDEYARLRAGGRPVADVLRRGGLGESQASPQPVPELNREAWQSLARVTANLNQLARRSNEGERVDPDLRPVLEALSEQVQALRAALIGGAR